MQGSTLQPKIFISYSWTTPQHEQWVINLAERLTGDGIVVILDKWDLKEGQDMHVFIEQMVQNKEISKVLVICDKGYQKKANDRQGGVGKETQLISKEVYEKVDQEKFIPVVKELDEDGKPCIPHYMSTRIYINLSDEGAFEENYQKLIRNLYNKPALRKPALGTPPAYILEEEQAVLPTAHKVGQIKSAMLNDRQSAQGLTYDYLDTFLQGMEDYRLSGGSQPDFDEKVVISIDKMLPLRDDFVDFILTLFKYGKDVNREKLHNFFEKLSALSFKPEHVERYTEVDFDNYRFFIYEIFLYFISALLQLDRYEDLIYFLYTPYFIRYNGKLEHFGVGIFNEYCRSLDEIRNRRLKLNRVCVTADLIKQRALRKDITFDKLLDSDLILYYISELNTDQGFGWFPRCSVYGGRWSGHHIELFERMVSKSHFEKVKGILNIKDIKELETKINLYLADAARQRGSSVLSFDRDVVPLNKIFELDKIAQIK